jgi:hypothetical protein
MSRETTAAAAEARYRAAAWKSHRLNCPRCAAAARSRSRDGLCAADTEVHAAYGRARQELEHSRELDKQPGPGQQTLF